MTFKFDDENPDLSEIQVSPAGAIISGFRTTE